MPVTTRVQTVSPNCASGRGNRGFDPNKWFENVELIVARYIGEAKMTYVGNVYKYYIAYELALGQPAQK